MKYISEIALIILVLGCSKQEPKLVYETNSDSDSLRADNIILDTTLTEVAGLPIHFDSTDYLIHAIGEYNWQQRESKTWIGSGYSGSSDFDLIYESGSGISGDLTNIYIQHVDSATITPLTKKIIKIRSIDFLTSVHKSNNKKVIVYSVTDRDTNKDQKLNSDDIESLYLSHISGSNFHKITPELQELIDWKIIDVQNRIYFRTIEDIDKNGAFDRQDKLHYFYIDFDQDELAPVEYNVLN